MEKTGSVAFSATSTNTTGFKIDYKEVFNGNTYTLQITKAYVQSSSAYGYYIRPMLKLQFQYVNTSGATKTIDIYNFRSDTTDGYGSYTTVPKDTSSWTYLAGYGSLTGAFTKTITITDRSPTQTQASFIITKADGSSLSKPMNYIISMDSLRDIEDGYPTMSKSITLMTLYTAPSAPTGLRFVTQSGCATIGGKYWYSCNGDTNGNGGYTQLAWNAAINGINNTVQYYVIECSYNNGAYNELQQATLLTSSKIGLNVSNYNYSFRIKAHGQYSDSDYVYFGMCYRNTKPSKPTISNNSKVAYDATKFTALYQLGSISNGGTASICIKDNTNNVVTISNNTFYTSKAPYKLYTYDGLDYSDEVQLQANLAQKPVVLPGSWSSSTSDGYLGTQYISSIVLSQPTSTLDPTASVSTYQVIYVPTSVTITSSNISVYSSKTTSFPYTYKLNGIEGGANFYIGLRVQDSYGGWSDISYIMDNTTKHVFTKSKSPDIRLTGISVQCAINNQKQNITDLPVSLINYYYKYVNISFNHLTDDTGSLQGVKQFIIYTKNGENEIQLYKKSGSIFSGGTITAMCEPTSAQMESLFVRFICNDNSSIERSIVTATYKQITPVDVSSQSLWVSMSDWAFFQENSSGELLNTVPYFTVGRPYGSSGDSSGFATIQSMYIQVSFDETNWGSDNTPLAFELTTEQKYQITFTPTGVTTFRNYINQNSIKTSKTVSYRLLVYDYFGNNSYTSNKVQTLVNFGYIPKFVSSDFSIKLNNELFNDSTAGYNKRILTANDTITINWPQGKIGGNMSGADMQFCVEVVGYDISAPATQLFKPSQWSTSVKTYDIQRWYLTKDITTLSFQPKYDTSKLIGIKIQVYVLDTNTYYSTAHVFDFALGYGRCVYPVFSINSFELNDENKPIIVFKVEDYGDSRIYNSTFATNTPRLLILTDDMNYESIITKITGYTDLYSAQFNNSFDATEDSIQFIVYCSVIPNCGSTIKYTYLVIGATFSARKNCVGVNSTNIENSQNVVTITPTSSKKYIKLNSVQDTPIYLDLSDRKIYGAIIDCGSW